MPEKHRTKTLQKYVEKLETATAIDHLNLTLVPLRGQERAQLDYILSEEAIEAGTLTVTEVDEGGAAYRNYWPRTHLTGWFCCWMARNS